jgi:hypothetical protein
MNHNKYIKYLQYLESLPLSQLLQGGCAVSDEVVPSVHVPVVHLNPGQLQAFRYIS